MSRERLISAASISASLDDALWHRLRLTSTNLDEIIAFSLGPILALRVDRAIWELFMWGDRSRLREAAEIITLSLGPTSTSPIDRSQFDLLERGYFSQESASGPYRMYFSERGAWQRDSTRLNFRTKE